MRCPDCNRFVGNEEQDPEINEIFVGDDGHVTVEARIVNACQDCGTELTEATFSLEGEVDLNKHQGEGHEVDAEEESSTRTSRSGYFDKKKGWVPSGGRYAKTFYGLSVEIGVTCSCGEPIDSITLEDEIQASGMDSLV